MNNCRLPRLVLLTISACLAGCTYTGPATGSIDPSRSVVNEVAEILRNASSIKPPTKLSDLSAQEQLNPTGYRSIKDGSVIVIYGVALAGEGEAKSGGPIVAYEKDTLTAGGYVVLTSGEVKKLTAAEFAAAPKAGKK